MNNYLTKWFLENGILVNPEVFGIFQLMPEEDIKKVLENFKRTRIKILTKEIFTEHIKSLVEGVGGDAIEKININFGVSITLSKKIESLQSVSKNNPKIIVRQTYGNKVKKLEVEDFVRHFRNRFAFLKDILQQRGELSNLTSINKMPPQKQQSSIIGIVSQKRVSKNKNIILDVEDLTGRTVAIINHFKEELCKTAGNILLDDIIGIKGISDKDKIYVSDIFYPDSFLHEKTLLENDESAAFISDVHVGSTHFLEKPFLKFLDWINGNVGEEKQRQEALKVKYLFITGDTVDGVGVFPGQESLISIPDIAEQYSVLAHYLMKIRDDVSIIMCPGQHDSVRVAEPQPAIPKVYAPLLHEMKNVTLVSNPACVEILNNGKRGVRVLMYHGASFHGFISSIDELRINKAVNYPTKIIRHVLKRRHLAPSHSLVTYIPDNEEDSLVIKDVPDIITTGDLHRPEMDTYNNILMISCSCWQSITPFEEKVGNHPLPCKVPVLNLKTREAKILDFSENEI